MKVKDIDKLVETFNIKKKFEDSNRDGYYRGVQDVITYLVGELNKEKLEKKKDNKETKKEVNDNVK